VVYTTDNHLAFYALKANTGAVLWSVNGIDGGSAAVVKGVLYLNARGITALNASNGTVLWNTSIQYASGMPAVANGMLYIGSLRKGNVYALNTKTGKVLWTYQTGGPVESSVAVANGVVYVSATNASGMYALNAQTGKLLWNYNTGFTQSSPIIVNGMVYVGSGGTYAFGLP
jgi:outer membrane protein assembly factor BamB